jgi:hypothetical protein
VLDSTDPGTILDLHERLDSQDNLHRFDEIWWHGRNTILSKIFYQQASQLWKRKSQIISSPSRTWQQAGRSGAEVPFSKDFSQ